MVVELSVCRVDLATGRVSSGEGAAELTRTELRLLRHLVAHPGRVLTPDELLREVWGYAPGVVTRTHIATVHRLRTKIERDPGAPDHLLTEWGRGFRWQPREDVGAVPAIPLSVDRFVGRCALLDEVAAALDQRRVVTLTGPGGVGKTRIASELAARLGRARVGLVRADVPDVVAAEVRAHVQLGTAMVLLDGAERAAHELAAAIPHWVVAREDVRILVTSRAELGLPGESVVPVPPLDTEAARTLFLDRAARPVRGDPALDAPELWEALDGLPAAIEWAAWLTEVLTPAQLLELVTTNPLDGLVAPRGDRSLRHLALGTLAALAPEERLGARALARLRGAFTPADAARSGVTPVLLRRLLGKSVLFRGTDGLRLWAAVRCALVT